MRRLLLLSVVAGLALAGCGDSQPSGTRTDSPGLVTPPATATATPSAPAATPTTDTTPATTPAPTVTAPTTTPATTTTATTDTDQGDEQGTRVPASFRVGPDRASPKTITVPPFLAIELKLRSSDGNPHTVIVMTPGTPTTVDVPATGTAVKRLEGLKRGAYALRIDDAQIGTLDVKDDVGP